jgi:hypothetical protein
MDYTTCHPQECPTEKGPCVQRQQGGKDDRSNQQNRHPHRDIAFGKHAGLCLFDQKQRISCSFCPGLKLRTTKALIASTNAHSRGRGMAYG